MIMLQTIGTRHGLNVSTTPIMAKGCWQCLPLSVVQLKVKHCRKPHCSNGVVDTFRLGEKKSTVSYKRGMVVTPLRTTRISGLKS